MRASMSMRGVLTVGVSIAGCYASHERAEPDPERCFPEIVSIVIDEMECRSEELRGGDDIYCVTETEPPTDRHGRVLPTPATWRAVEIRNRTAADGRWTLSATGLDRCTEDGICFAYRGIDTVRAHSCECDGGGVTSYREDDDDVPLLGETVATLPADSSVTLLLHNPGAVYRVGGCVGVSPGP